MVVTKVVDVVSIDNVKADKKLRKKQKKLKQQSEKQPEVEAAVIVEVASTTTSTTVTSDEVDLKAKEEKKRAKKEKKRMKRDRMEENQDQVKKKDAADMPTDAKKAAKKIKTSGPFKILSSKDGSFKKSFYEESEETAAVTQDAVTKFYAANEMSISGNKCNYTPVLKFKHVNFPTKVMKCCEGFDTPTPIQSQGWPILSCGRDIIGIAQTGSGKTIAFAIPGLLHILDQKPVSRQSSGPIMLVVAPTRELAMQSADVISKAGSFCDIKCICVFGGVPKYEQKKALREGVHVVVATPGRLEDLLNDSFCSLKRVTYLVLDEADRLLDEGFEKPIRNIIGATHPERQIAMFSATWPKSVQELAHEFLVDPVKVTCGSDDLVASQSVTQIVEVVDDYKRDGKINGLLQKYHSSRKNRIIVFVLYKKEAVRVERFLQSRGWNCIAIHGDKAQNQRIEAVEKFKSGEIPLLVATDVAARGLDIPNVEYVINYAFPLTIEDYVHRIGRTGRGGKLGISHTFFTNFDKPRAGELVNLLREAKATIPEELLKFGTHVKKKEHKLYGAFSKNLDMTKKATKITFDNSDDDA